MIVELQRRHALGGERNNASFVHPPLVPDVLDETKMKVAHRRDRELAEIGEEGGGLETIPHRDRKRLGILGRWMQHQQGTAFGTFGDVTARRRLN